MLQSTGPVVSSTKRQTSGKIFCHRQGMHFRKKAFLASDQLLENFESIDWRIFKVSERHEMLVKV